MKKRLIAVLCSGLLAVGMAAPEMPVHSVEAAELVEDAAGEEEVDTASDDNAGSDGEVLSEEVSEGDNADTDTETTEESPDTETETTAEVPETETTVESPDTDTETTAESPDTETVSTETLYSDGTYSIDLANPTNTDDGAVSVDRTDEDGATIITLKADGAYDVSGFAQNTGIVVAESVSAEITLNGATFDDSDYTGSAIEAVIDCGKKSNVSITLSGANTIFCNPSSSKMENGIKHNKNAGDSLTIDGDGSLTIKNTADDGIKYKNGTVAIENGTLKILNCHDDGIQAENINISGGKTKIVTTFDNASESYYTSGSSASGGTLNMIWEENNGTKYERVNVDTGSHKALKGGTKAETEVFPSSTSTTNASGGITISGGTVIIDTTAAGLKANSVSTSGYTKTSSGVYIIGGPDDGIHSNNTLSISGGKIKIAASDDAITAASDLSITGTPTINISTCYEGIEGGDIVIGESGSTSGPTIKINSNDDGINAASKTVTYTYDEDDNDDDHYLKASVSNTGNTCKVYSGTVRIDIDSVNTKSTTLDSKTISYKASGDGIDCNGTLDIEGGKVFVFGQSTGDNSPIDTDNGFTLGGDAVVLAAGIDEHGETVPESGSGVYLDYSGSETTATAYKAGSSSSSGSNGPGPNGGGFNGGPSGPGGGGNSSTISAGKVFNVLNGSTYLISKTLPYAASYVLYASPKLTSGNSYTISLTDSENSAAGDTEDADYTIDDDIDDDSAISLSGATVSGLSNRSYTGSSIRPAIEVKVGTKTLTLNSDYSVSYASNTNVGTATVQITGIGNYTGSITKTFSITAKKISPKISLSQSSYAFNGSAKKPTVVVRDGSTKLSASNYTVTYASGRKAIGSYTVKVTLKNNYSGNGKASFEIVPKGTKLKSVSKGYRSFTAKWRKQATQTTGYQLQYATNKDFNSAKKVTIKSTAKLTQTIGKLSGGKKYYVRIRCYKTVSKTPYYSAWSKALNVTPR